MHAALIAAGFPDEIKEQCASITDFAKPASWSRSNACTKSKGSRSWDAECTPECIEYFEKSGVECELAEDAAKLQVAKALDAALEGAPMKGNDKKALFAWYRFIYSLNGDEDEEGVEDRTRPSESRLTVVHTVLEVAKRPRMTRALANHFC